MESEWANSSCLKVEQRYDKVRSNMHTEGVGTVGSSPCMNSDFVQVPRYLDWH